MKCWLIIAGLMACVSSPAQVSFGISRLFNDGWIFCLDNDSSATIPPDTTALWRRVSLPHDWSVEGVPDKSLASCTGFLPGGIGWYVKHFTVSDSLPLHYIYFEGVYNRSSVYINGRLLGTRPSGFASFLYDLSPYLRAGDNVLSVHVDHSRSADCRWYTGSGIYRNVWLIAAPAAHIAPWGVGWSVNELTERGAVLDVDVGIEGVSDMSADVVAILIDGAGREVARKRNRVEGCRAGMSLEVQDPQLWSVDTPYLYTLRTELYVSDRLTDSCDTPVGLRTFAFDADKGFFLNGNSLKIKGVCLHHDAGVLGAAVPREVWTRRLKELKAMGANAVRMSHNPQAPVVYDLCDSLGLLVMDEVADEWEYPKRKWIKGWNRGTPGYDGASGFFEEWIERDVADMVRRDRTHPCVFLWSIGNEVDYPNDPYSHPVLDDVSISQPSYGGYVPSAPDAGRLGAIAERLAAVVRSIDRSRPVTAALAGVVMSNQTGYPAALDVVGYNYSEHLYDCDHNA
ncbi:MAG: glycoside hydrolase family 2, partial [Prevotella sp.]|nr:glycoside hydrolase family 2 [Prevotella sp.]